MKHIFYLFFLILSYSSLCGQCGNDHIDEEDFQLKSTCTNPSTDKHKIIRVNFHFIKGDSSHKTNFTPTSDGDGDMTMTGYKYADSITTLMNQWASHNPVMNVRNTAYNTRWGNGWNKNYSFVLDAVYFDSIPQAYYYAHSGTIANSIIASYPLILKDTNSVINIVINFRHSSAESNGYGSRSINTTVMGMRKDYMDKKAINQLDWHFDVMAGLTMHELGHIFNISHTVVDSDSQDDCQDTPSRTEASSITGESDYKCDWDIRFNWYCTNNIMDYTGGNALTPCQLEKIHCSLENYQRATTVCKSVSNNLYLADIGYPKLAYFGKNIIIGNNSNYANLVAKEKCTLYFSETVVLNNFAIENNDVEFEVKFSPTCNF